MVLQSTGAAHVPPSAPLVGLPEEERALEEGNVGLCPLSFCVYDARG